MDPGKLLTSGNYWMGEVLTVTDAEMLKQEDTL